MTTIRDVAKAAGVSVSTVSRALNGYQDVNEKTRRRIQETSRQLGYIPNQSAKNLSSKTAKNVALLISGIATEDKLDEFTGNLIRGVYEYMNEQGDTIAIYGITSQMQEEKSLETMCHEYSLSGVMFMGMKVQDCYLKEVADIGIPCVSIDVVPQGGDVAVVTTDDEAAFEEITDYVLDRGHKQVVLLSGNDSAQVTYLRQAGFENSLKKHGINVQDMDVLKCRFLEEVAYENTKSYIQKYRKTKATAFICMSDLMALGVCRAVAECGYRVPDDFSVTGFDGLLILDYIRPYLTTISQNITGKGYQGVRTLMQMVSGRPFSGKIYVPYRLVERESVKDIHF